MEQEGDEEQVETVHLGERGLLPQRAGERQGQPGARGDHRPDAEADHDQHRDPDRGCGSGCRQEVGPVGNGSDGDQREGLVEQDVQGVARRVQDPEA